ncbi:MAG: cytochrome c [Deltaproteobacteria bacterium]|nr:MAG: cytochrome c [Deltaproteobacteria bacterium]
MSRVLAVAALLVGLTGCLLTPHSDTPLDTGLYAEVMALSGDPVAGEEPYEANCRRCHGREATGTLRGVPIASYDVDEIVEVMLTGPGHMPTFDDLEPQVVADIAAYVNSLEPQ